MTVLRNALFAAALAVPATSALAEIDILSVTFTCENGIPLPVTYFNASDGSGAAATIVDNTLVAMRQVESGSGIRYESSGDQGTYILRSKGWNASISYLAAGAANEQAIFQDCSSR
ncbi:MULTISPECIES: MliC family protein [unclassified Ruegeria]|uniref:MliC family protein n=1 Tax=unclassified Ruegeria TaxID=2625375 RepID=UPI0014891302|nr:MULTISPECIES: MliC family protein [unclassified Ruegeria]NOD33575.1 lysozyme inhibitor [Ruegeria sp. HKCCD7296]NOE40750.1 lysozyme inhibitor [Ruegeria sp. HKCCD7319]